MPAVGCSWAEPSVRRVGFEGYEVKEDEADGSMAVNGGAHGNRRADGMGPAGRRRRGFS